MARITKLDQLVINELLDHACLPQRHYPLRPKSVALPLVNSKSRPYSNGLVTILKICSVQRRRIFKKIFSS